MQHWPSQPGTRALSPGLSPRARAQRSPLFRRVRSAVCAAETAAAAAVHMPAPIFIIFACVVLGWFFVIINVTTRQRYNYDGDSYQTRAWKRFARSTKTLTARRERGGSRAWITRCDNRRRTYINIKKEERQRYTGERSILRVISRVF